MAGSLAYRHLWAVVIGLIGAVMSGCANEALLAPLNWSETHSQIIATTDLAYGTDVRQKLDVYRPQTAQRAPVMVFWHGGSWQHGDKDYTTGSSGQPSHGAASSRSWPDYRLAPEHPFPAFVKDAASAVRWARDHAEDYGGDRNRVYISGYSAGGHSALMLALDPQYLHHVGLAQSDIAGVVSLAGPSGLENLRGKALRGVFPQTVADSAFSPMALASSHAANAPPILLMIGLDDDVIHASSVAKLADAIRAGGGMVAVKAYSGIGHIGQMLGFAAAFEGSGNAADDMARFAAPLMPFNSVATPGQGEFRRRTPSH